MIIAALLSAIHMLTLALGAGGIYLRGRALARPLDEEGWRRLLAADNAWGVAALLWITSGLGRVFFGGKDPGFFWNNGFFWIKMALFGVVFLLELRPMMTFIRVRQARGRRTPLPSFPLDIYQRLNQFELALIVAMVFVAAFMARGAWLF
jgi:putative membrane protein